jgi:hypothetical protein
VQVAIYGVTGRNALIIDNEMIQSEGSSTHTPIRVCTPQNTNQPRSAHDNPYAREDYKRVSADCVQQLDAALSLAVERAQKLLAVMTTFSMRATQFCSLVRNDHARIGRLYFREHGKLHTFVNRVVLSELVDRRKVVFDAHMCETPSDMSVSAVCNLIKLYDTPNDRGRLVSLIAKVFGMDTTVQEYEHASSGKEFRVDWKNGVIQFHGAFAQVS